MKKFLFNVIVSTFVLIMAVPVASAASTYFQGFEIDATDWSSNGYGIINRVPSGTNGITSADGSFHAIVEEDEGTGPFTRFDGYRNTWPGKWTAQVDVYLDTNWSVGEGFDYSVAANGSDGNHRRDFIFHVTKDTSTGDLLVGASNNTNFTVREDLETINHYVVPSSGWYTLQHVFRDNGGVLAVDMNLLDSNGNILFTETRSDASDTIPAIVGGNRYGWFTFISVPGGIAIDNQDLTLESDRVSGEITNPATDGMTISGLYNFTAIYDDSDNINDDAVQWAIRSGNTCNNAAGTVFGNVDGHNDSFAWDGKDFSANFDTSTVPNGEYCFIFNPTDDQDQPDIRLTRTFTINQYAVPEACANIENLGAPIIGTDGSEKINGTNGNDLIFALGGSDKIDGKGGNDCIVAGSGSDKIVGGSGNDVILGGDGSDSIEGNAGNDTIYGDGGSDSINGNNGQDTIYGGDGDDSLKGEGDNDYIDGNGGNDLILGGGGNQDACYNGSLIKQCEIL